MQADQNDVQKKNETEDKEIIMTHKVSIKLEVEIKMCLCVHYLHISSNNSSHCLQANLDVGCEKLILVKKWGCNGLIAV